MAKVNVTKVKVKGGWGYTPNLKQLNYKAKGSMVLSRSLEEKVKVTKVKVKGGLGIFQIFQGGGGVGKGKGFQVSSQRI